MQIWNPFASFTRPNNVTAYAVGNLVANSVTAGSVLPLSLVFGNTFPKGQARITRARLSKSGTLATNANFRIHLYAVSPVAANGDGGAWSSDNAANWLGNIDVTSMLAFTDGCAGTGSAAAGSEMLLRTNTPIFALVEAKAAYVPAANEVFTLTLETLEAY
jgi:hypothetical protein